MFQFRIDHYDGVVVMVGEIDLAAASQAADAIAAARKGRDVVVVELDEVTFMDSTGLRMLLGPAVDDVVVTLRRPSDPVLSLLKMTGVEDRFIIEY